MEAIFREPLNVRPLRFQKLRITLQNYNFITKYKPGNQLYFADALTRVSYDDKNCQIREDEMNGQGNIIYGDNVISQGKFKKYASENNKDFKMSKINN